MRGFLQEGLVLRLWACRIDVQIVAGLCGITVNSLVEFRMVIDAFVYLFEHCSDTELLISM